MQEVDKRELFFKLVNIQDTGVSVTESRSRIAAEYSIDLNDVCKIESEGIEKAWPPLE